MTYYFSDAVYEIFHPKKHHRERRSLNEESVPKQISLSFHAFGEYFDLRLKQNTHLLLKNFRIQEEDNSAIDNDPLKGTDDNITLKNPVFNESEEGMKNKTKKNNKDVKVSGLNCFFQGYSTFHPNSSAALSLCNGIVSII